MIIHLIRHTTPEIESGVCYGQADLDVTPSFPQEVATVKSKLQDKYDRVYSSPLQRCTKLAEACLPEQASLDERLMEFDFGDWELKPWREIKGDAADAWFGNFVELPCPNGESMNTMRTRVMDFYQELIEQDIESAAVFTHFRCATYYSCRNSQHTAGTHVSPTARFWCRH